MFDFITDAIENVLDIGDSLLYGELPSKRQTANLISAGLTVASIAATVGVAESVIESLLED